jgi:inosine/xanthosine triphosphate pyrophosphatase family protein
MEEIEVKEKGLIEEVLEANEPEEQTETIEDVEEVEIEDRKAGGTVTASAEPAMVDPTGVIADALESLGRGYSQQSEELKLLRDNNEKLSAILRAKGYKV